MGLSEQKLELLIVALQSPDKVRASGNRARTLSSLIASGYLEHVDKEYRLTDKGRPYAEREYSKRMEAAKRSREVEREWETSAYALKLATKQIRKVKSMEISGFDALDALAELIEALQEDERIMSTRKSSGGL